MKYRHILILVIVGIFIACEDCNAKLRIAILDLKAGVGRTQEQVDGLADMLAIELFNSGKFSIVERTDVERVLSANNIKPHSPLTPSQRNLLVEKFHTDAVVIGTVNYIIRDTKLASNGVNNINIGEYNVDIRLIRTEDGEMISAAGGREAGNDERGLMTRIAQELARNLAGSDAVVPKEPFILSNYLYVFPEDLGDFRNEPTNIINIINRNASYNYSDWRLPDQEELELMIANARRLNLDNGKNYAYQNAWSYGTEYRVRLVRTAPVIVSRQRVTNTRAFFENTTYDFGRIPIFNGKVQTYFCLQNPTTQRVSIQSVTKTNSNISVKWDNGWIEPSQSAYILVTYDPNGRQGAIINSLINVQLSDGQKIELSVTGKVE